MPLNLQVLQISAPGKAQTLKVKLWSNSLQSEHWITAIVPFGCPLRLITKQIRAVTQSDWAAVASEM